MLYENELDGIEYIWSGLGIEHMTVIIIKNAVKKYPFDTDMIFIKCFTPAQLSEISKFT